ncbi:MAG: DUF2520 domain-containing protein [Clostridiales Family XIII bacterium]|jgi:predicted short-subunit dehydrogenase-like oxidoreductase (DUF2520 family)|nr:DUF2520 domain-containing protein [Clostridiales Family XIII bacterium]
MSDINKSANNNSIKIGFIGAGRAGCSLGKMISEGAARNNGAPGISAEPGAPDANAAAPRADIELAGYYSRSPGSSRDAAAFTGSHAYRTLGELLTDSDIVVASVPDDAIAEIWEQTAAILAPAAPSMPTASAPAAYSKPTASSTSAASTPAAPEPMASARRPRAICHLSGGMTSEVFAGADSLGIEAASLHPLYAIADRHASWQGLSRASFTFEGSDAACVIFAPLLGQLRSQGASAARIGTDKKNLYHAACVFFSNFVCGLAGIGEDIFRECGLDGEFAASAWHTLFADNAKNVVRMGAAGALTGPAERGDAGTVLRHIESLSALSHQAGTAAHANNYSKIYREMTCALTKIAARKNPERDYANILSGLTVTEPEA